MAEFPHRFASTARKPGQGGFVFCRCGATSGWLSPDEPAPETWGSNCPAAMAEEINRLRAPPRLDYRDKPALVAAVRLAAALIAEVERVGGAGSIVDPEVAELFVQHSPGRAAMDAEELAALREEVATLRRQRDLRFAEAEDEHARAVALGDELARAGVTIGRLTAERDAIDAILAEHLNGWIEAREEHPDQPEMGPRPTLLDGVRSLGVHADRLRDILDAETGKRGPEGWYWADGQWNREAVALWSVDRNPCPFLDDINADNPWLPTTWTLRFETLRFEDPSNDTRNVQVIGTYATALEAMEAADLAAKEK